MVIIIERMIFLFQDRVKVRNKIGLHARSASRLVQKANEFDSEIVLQYNGREANAKSILGVMSLGVKQGSNIVLKAQGEDETDAVITLRELIDKISGDEE